MSLRPVFYYKELSWPVLCSNLNKESFFCDKHEIKIDLSNIIDWTLSFMNSLNHNN